MDWESNVWKNYGIVWETHTLCKRHAWSECDAHGGNQRRATKAFGVRGGPPGEAEEYATIINNYKKGFHNTKAFAVRNIDRTGKSQRAKEMEDLFGMKKASEFQYVFTDENGVQCRQPGVVLTKEISGDERKYSVSDLNKKLCRNCSYASQRPVEKHRLSDCPYKHFKQGQMPGQMRSLLVCTSRQKNHS